ncbi:endonuclease/exonuclease/phosphatase family protein [Actinomadura algeriensis]|uniref:Endonuclease/exonuclease/phosphatase family metal-dependent hydrolase n=1 Tax=Actinomadura algeriensis TaxID=1679523 RepID=A0ABR9JPM9_9ACTN|nr:endonuclease/exonuclease/phosphatase family protein [Actinomadura algeriensis]MBE1532512.1 endonuclease/exonuclease/phosphatase family metal-dependent hydrolase [Actinomadura algeriensis]
MRTPRALIPLLSVAAAAVVVTVAGAGAAINGVPGGGPAHADSVAREVPSATVNAVTWNVCGEDGPGCPLGARPDELTDRIAERAGETVIGGREVEPNAVLLQEVCAGQVEKLQKADGLDAWSWKFAEYPDAAECADDQGRLGLAIGTESPLAGTETKKLPAPEGAGRIVLCGEVGAWSARVCVTQFTPSGDDPGGEWRTKQAGALADFAGTGRVVIGGDLADGPKSAALDPLYDAYNECDQGPGTTRTGDETLQDWRGTAVEKNDFIFMSKSASVSCGVPADPVESSDHRPLSAAVRFR